MTDETELAIDVAAIDVKKDIENDAHPVVKSLWAEFKGDVSEFLTWIKAEIEKI